jgi:uncharacterized protein
MTGWFRDGYCRTDENDNGKHVVCVHITEDFLKYSKAVGNDLKTPRPPTFPGLREGDKWCLCAMRWAEAFKLGLAPMVDLEATNKEVLHYCSLEDLMSKAGTQD